MTALAFTSGQSAAAAAWATFAVLVITAGFAAWQLRQARQLRREETRPFVVLQYEFRSVLIQIAIKNLGRTVARNVRISFDQPLTSKQWDKRDFSQLALLREGIPSLVPGQEIRIHFDHFPNRVTAGLPMRYTATVEYDDHEGRKLKPETYVLDLAPFADTAQSPKGMPELVSEVERITQEMRKWTDGVRGLLVHQTDLDTSNQREYRPYRLGRAMERKEKEGWRGFANQMIDDFRRRHGLYADR